MLELSKRVTRLDPPRVNDLVSQLNPVHFLASQKNFNPTGPITCWQIKQIGSLAQLIKNNIFFLFFRSKLNCNSN